MTTAYTTSSALTTMLGTRRMTMLQDRDEDGIADASVLTQAISDAGAEIDAQLSQHYDVPFAAITDTPATPAKIELIARYLAAHYLYKQYAPNGPDQEYYWSQAMAEIKALQSHDIVIPGASRVDGSSGLIAVSISNDEPQFSGRDSNDERRWRGM